MILRSTVPTHKDSQNRRFHSYNRCCATLSYHITSVATLPLHQSAFLTNDERRTSIVSAFRRSFARLSAGALRRNATHPAATTSNLLRLNLHSPRSASLPLIRIQGHNCSRVKCYARSFCWRTLVQAKPQRREMASRPNYIDLRSQSHGPFTSGLSSPKGLPSPRLHVAGDIAPDLSPLDAFAAQSRMLAKQLDDSIKSGRRVSRLHPLTIASSFNQGRPSYFRSVSAEAPAAPGTQSSPSFGSGLKTEIENPGFRPVSVHPQFSGAPSTPSQPLPRSNTYQDDETRGRSPSGHAIGREYFGARIEQSPTALQRDQRSIRSENFAPRLSSRPSRDSLSRRGPASRRDHDRSYGTPGYNSNALAPPQAPFAQTTPSPRSMSNDSSDDDFSISHMRSILSREPSQCSENGLSTSPISMSINSMARSPSISSEISAGGTSLPRPAFNFSRPLSRASASGLATEIPSRQASSDSQPSLILADDTAHTPVSMNSEHADAFRDVNTNENGAASSYVYSRFTLPRGKMLQRNSVIFQEELASTTFPWERPTTAPNGNENTHTAAPPSPPLRPSTSLDPGRPSLDTALSFLDPNRPSQDANRATNEPRQSTERLRASTPHEVHGPPPSVSSSATIKARSQHSLASTADMSGEEHVKLGIEAHEAGSLSKSTYHLRLAARQNHPTGMLLYALACRHGWGMRPNQKEGVLWLRRAAESASLEVADDEDLMKDGKPVDVLERKTRKAQFALSIYELGVSHMNGWGIQQDKALALRCFEIAGCS